MDLFAPHCILGTHFLSYCGVRGRLHCPLIGRGSVGAIHWSRAKTKTWSCFKAELSRTSKLGSPGRFADTCINLLCEAREVLAGS
jgi:hypothetical protein